MVSPADAGRGAALLALLVTVAAPVALARDGGEASRPPDPQSPAQDVAAFNAVVEMVRVPVVVVDAEGSFVEGLEHGDFRVEDGDTVQAVEHFVSEDEPTSVAVVLDAGAAAAPIADSLRRSAATVHSMLRPLSEVAVIRAGRRPDTLAGLSGSAAAIRDGAAGFRSEPSGGPALHDAVLHGIRELEKGRWDKRTLIVFGVGDDVGSRADLASVKDAAQRAGVTVHTVWIGTRGLGPDDGAPGTGPPASEAIPIAAMESSRSRSELVELARFTGGLVARRPGIEDRFGGLRGWMTKACEDIGRYINHQYLLHYTPRQPPATGAWRPIRVRVSVPFDEVRTRAGYRR